jgi:hypothetical protein
MMPVLVLCNNTRQSGQQSPFLTHHRQSFSYFSDFLALPYLVVNISPVRDSLPVPDRVTASGQQTINQLRAGFGFGSFVVSSARGIGVRG